MRKKNIEFISFAKGFAILSIMAYHFLTPLLGNGYLYKLVKLGGAGVHLFLLLSGFGLFLSMSNRVSAFQFYKKRFVKILVPYFIVVIVISLINYFLQLYDNNGHSLAYILFGHLLFYKMFDNSIVESLGGHLWFMSTLVQFYIAFPIIYWLQQLCSDKRFFLIALMISSIYWGCIIFFHVDHLRIFYSFFIQYLWEFSLGMILARRWLNYNDDFWDQKTSKLALYTIISYIFMVIITLALGNIGKILNDVPSSLGFLFLTCLMFKISGKLILLRRWISEVGHVSYELYLTHMLVLSLYIHFIFDSTSPHYLLVIFGGGAVAIIVAKLFSHLLNSFIKLA